MVKFSVVLRDGIYEALRKESFTSRVKMGPIINVALIEYLKLKEEKEQVPLDPEGVSSGASVDDAVRGWSES